MRLAYTDSAMNTFLSLDRTVQKRVKKYMDEVQALDDPRSRGHALTGELSFYGDIVWVIGESSVK